MRTVNYLSPQAVQSFIQRLLPKHKWVTALILFVASIVLIYFLPFLIGLVILYLIYTKIPNKALTLSLSALLIFFTLFIGTAWVAGFNEASSSSQQNVNSKPKETSLIQSHSKISSSPTISLTPTTSPTTSYAESVLGANTSSVITPTNTLSLTPTRSHPASTIQSTPKPTSDPTSVPKTPVPTTCQAVNNNPWCYNFIPGNAITTPPQNFCDYFNCIKSFWNGQGYVEECQDGTYSLSGGIQGSCSWHGGDLQELYSH